MLLKNLILPVLDAGSQYELPEYLKNRVRPTNVICLLVIFALAIPFVIISLIFFPRMAIFPAGAAVVSALVLLANHLGGIYYSRVVLPLLLLTLSSLYNAYFCNSIGDAIPSVYLVELSFTLIPFVIFDYSEKGFLIFCTIYSFLIISVFPEIWEYFDMGYSGEVLRSGPLAVLTTTLATIFQVGCIMGLAAINRESEKRSNQLFEDSNRKNAQLEQSRQELEANLDQLAKARLVENNRQWAAEGEAKLSEIMRSQLEEEQIYDRMLAMVVQYVQANQGSLYVVDRDDRSSEVRIRMVSCYAYNRKKYQEQTFEPGQGLLGQAYLEGEYIYLTEIPQNYTYITSGLGEATPTSLIVVPLKVNESTEGMLEIASFNTLAPHEIDLLIKLGESMAAFIQSNRINVQTKFLLQEAQQRTEEMRAQEEEMRQNMEELEATQEEMRRKEDAYLREIERLKRLYEANGANTGLQDNPADRH